MISNAVKQQVSVTLPPDLLARLDREAAEQRRSRSNMLSALLARIFEESPRRERSRIAAPQESAHG